MTEIETRLLRCRFLGEVDYEKTWQQMRAFTDERKAETPDELWLVEHPPVFTQGQAGKPEHILQTSDIPIVKSDRGGQVTYHGPGQLVAYSLVDLKRLKLGVRDLVTAIENSVVDFLAAYGVSASPRPKAPGVYVSERKIASLGLRVRKGRSYHGVAINIHTDLRPFLQINPCGYENLAMVNLADLVPDGVPPMQACMQQFAECLATRLRHATVFELSA